MSSIRCREKAHGDYSLPEFVKDKDSHRLSQPSVGHPHGHVYRPRSLSHLPFFFNPQDSIEPCMGSGPVCLNRFFVAPFPLPVCLYCNKFLNAKRQTGPQKAPASIAVPNSIVALPHHPTSSFLLCRIFFALAALNSFLKTTNSCFVN